jgi:hypothetical protein
MPSSGSVTLFGVRPQVVSAVTLGTGLVRVTFNEPLAPTGPTVDPTNYTITADVGSAARTVSGVALDGDSPSPSVVLTLDGPLTDGIANYNVEVVDVTDVAGNVVDPAFDNVDFDGRYTAPGIESHCEEALARLLSQFSRSTRLRSLICALADQADPIEQNLWDVQAYRSIDTATGLQLDRLGLLLGLPREANTDADYRRFLRAKILANNSTGRADTLIQILELLDNGFDPTAITLREDFPAVAVLHCLVDSGDDALGEYFVRFLRQAKAVGTRVILHYEEDGPVLFQWDDGANPPGSGWGDGLWARAVD